MPTVLDGNALEMSPQNLVSAGLAYDARRFWTEAVANYVGERFLNKRNTAQAEAYVTFDAVAGVHLGQVDLRVIGRNVGDRRDPVAESELGESQFYRLPARAVELSAVVHL